MMAKSGRNSGNHRTYNTDRIGRGTYGEVKNDDVNKALRTLTKKVTEFGLLRELRSRMSYEKPAVEKQREQKQARKRWEVKVEAMIEDGLWLKEKNY